MKLKKSALNVLISAGPTREFIDPVRFISNSSTGTFGYLLAKTAKQLGHNIVLLMGPSNFKPIPGIETINFISALDLKKQMDDYFDWADCIICSAAVGDFRPVIRAKHKIKKNQMMARIKLRPNPDILKALGKKKKNKILVGFALESENLLKNAQAKLKAKNLDLIIANQIDSDKNPFGSGLTNAYLIDSADFKQYDNISKAKLVRIILDRISSL
ncbi:MAG: phosphopantothenoylcysteine decarboxylase [Candidatus Omnitrophica bacterium]|nr:phosphopantothenoylcysteine decarboxylase [Candidatus Omnitrophota bacterium]